MQPCVVILFSREYSQEHFVFLMHVVFCASFLLNVFFSFRFFLFHFKRFFLFLFFQDKLITTTSAHSWHSRLSAHTVSKTQSSDLIFELILPWEDLAQTTSFKPSLLIMALM